MEVYVQEALQQDYIRPSMSPVSARFFFVAKNGTGLCPYIDFWGLDYCEIPISLVPSVLEQLRSAQIFTKLDLHSTYNLVCVREGAEEKMSCSTTSGQDEYIVMWYGLSCTPLCSPVIY